MCLEQMVSSTPLGSTGSVDKCETIIVVEDEEEVRKVVCLTLELQGYLVLAAADAEQALALLRTRQGNIDLLIVDVVLPTLRGPELAELANQLQPGLQVLYISGYSDEALGELGVASDHANFLAKPFSSATLGRKVRQLMPR